MVSMDQQSGNSGGSQPPAPGQPSVVPQNPVTQPVVPESVPPAPTESVPVQTPPPAQPPVEPTPVEPVQPLPMTPSVDASATAPQMTSMEASVPLGTKPGTPVAPPETPPHGGMVESHPKHSNMFLLLGLAAITLLLLGGVMVLTMMQQPQTSAPAPVPTVAATPTTTVVTPTPSKNTSTTDEQLTADSEDVDKTLGTLDNDLNEATVGMQDKADTLQE